MKNIIHITPAIPPVTNGVGDFSFLLAQGIHQIQPVNNIFFISKETKSNTANQVIAFSAQTLYAQLKDSRPDVIILHYANYSYHPKGLPFYLVSAIKAIKNERQCRVLIYFHELYSSSTSLFKISFYTNILQKLIVKRLYKLADQTFTNCDIYGELLKSVVGSNGYNNKVVGLFSNIDDKLYDRSIHKEDNTLVIFGSLPRREKIVNKPEFIALLEQLGITDVYDIGSGQVKFLHQSIRFHAKGILPANEVAVYFNKARYGVIHYSTEILGKSGIFSAYAAFGIICINLLIDEQPLHDHLVKGSNYFDTQTAIPLNNLDKLKENIERWYSQRSQLNIAKVIVNYI
jgi:hypothetical protein